MRRFLFLFIVGVAAFIFFGFFAPILLSTSITGPKELFTAGKRLLSVPSRTPVTTIGSEVIATTLSQIERFRDGSRYAIALHCLKKDADSRCDQSAYKTEVPGFLTVLYDQMVGTNMDDGSIKPKADTLFADVLSRCGQDGRTCDEAFFALYNRYRNNADSSVLDGLKKAGERILTVPASTFSGKLFDIHKLIILSQLTAESTYTIVAQTRFEELGVKLDVEENPKIGSDKREPIRRFDCGYHLVEAELGELTGRAEYVTKARTFFDGVGKYYGSIGHLGALNFCLEGLSHFEKATGARRYGDEKQALISFILSHYWDTPIDNRFTGDYGFLLLDYSGPEVNRVLNFKYLSETLWFLTHVIPFSRSILTF